MSSALEPRAGATVTGLFLGSLALAGAVALVTAPITPRIAAAETAASPTDQPTVDPLPGRGRAAGEGRVDPLDHLSPGYRRNSLPN